MKLEVGKTYETGLGALVEIVGRDPEYGVDSEFIGVTLGTKDKLYYNEHGLVSHWFKSDFTIVSEIVGAPHTISIGCMIEHKLMRVNNDLFKRYIGLHSHTLGILLSKL